MRVPLLLLAIIFSTFSLWCQEVPKAEVFGGYSYMSLDTQGLTKRLNLNGWEASGTYNINRWLGVTGDVSGHYKSNCIAISAATNLNCSHLSFMAGPTISRRQDRVTGFAHLLAGGDTGKLGIGLATASDFGLAFAIGGGVDYAATGRLSIRVGQLDYLMTRHGQAVGGTHQNNLRASFGVVYTFGGSLPMSNQSAAAAKAPESRESASLGAAGYRTDAGFTITSVRAGSRAAEIFLKAGDVVSMIDGKAVHSKDDIDSAIAGAQSDTVKVTCILTTAVGKITSERNLKVR